MSWLYTIFFAGLLLSSDGKMPVQIGGDYTDSKINGVFAAEETERFEQTYPFNANGTISVSNVNGSITVETWDKNEIKLEYVKTADAKENLSEVTIRIDARQDAFSVETDYEDWKRRASGARRGYSKLQVEYRLTVPRRAALNEIETVNGAVSISNAANLTKASAVNGEVRATNLSGTADLSTVNGTVNADFDRLPASGKISLNTVNGTVNLMIPSDADATVKADTVNGSISNDFGLPVRTGQYVGRDMYGKIGAGSAQIRLNSVNGGLSVKRKNDGKNLNPATNLLNMKSDDDDWDDADNSPVKPPKPPKAPKPPKPPVNVEIDDQAIHKIVEQSLKDAGKELAAIQPELEKQYADALKQTAALNSGELQAKINEAQKKYGEAMSLLSENRRTAASPAVEKKSGSFAVKGTPKVTVEAQDCQVTVRGWDKPEVGYTVVRITRPDGQPVDSEWTTSATKNNEADVSFKISSESKANGKVFYDEASKISLEIFVPKKTDLKITTGGEIRLENVSGKFELHGDDGTIDIRDCGGQLSVTSDDARVRVIGFSGDVTAENEDGTMNFEGDFQTLSAQTVDGTIVLTLPENAAADIESNDKNIIGEGFTPDNRNLGAGVFLWKLGGGGRNHRLTATADGKIIVRNAGTLKTVQ